MNPQKSRATRAGVVSDAMANQFSEHLGKTDRTTETPFGVFCHRSANGRLHRTGFTAGWINKTSLNPICGRFADNSPWSRIIYRIRSLCRVVRSCIAVTVKQPPSLHNRGDALKTKIFASGQRSNSTSKLVRPLRRNFDRKPSSVDFTTDVFADPGRGAAEPPIDMQWNPVTLAYEFQSGAHFHQEGERKNA